VTSGRRLAAAVRSRWGTWLALGLLALLAYGPALRAAPGAVPADTKLYLYLDPGRQIADALWSFDARQFAGWVPHQTIGYLWPSGPWFWLFDHLGVPDWVAHRLWIGTILFAAGAGARWAARRLGIAPVAALAAAVVYQLSPFILAYVSRTSVLLLPWAALGWLVGLTIGAATRTRWRDAGIFALIVATVGGINATALLMVAPAPILWLLDAAASGVISWRRAARTMLTLGGLSLGVSLWWMTALLVQMRYGAQALSFSETLEAVSSTAAVTEVLRGLGYWLFYVGDPVTLATTAGRVYQEDHRLIAYGFALLLTGVAGLGFVRWGQRRFAGLCLLTGVILAVGAYPIDDPSPLGATLAASSRSTAVLALRSSTRAVPLVVFGLALGVGALVTAIGRWQPKVGMAGALTVCLLAVANLPAARTGGFVDPDLQHPSPLPTWWSEVGDALDALPPGYRVMQVPGVEFSTYRWGHTVDPPLPGLSDRPLVTRDLLPLGSPGAMDTLYALDDRFQAGVPEAPAVAPIARLFGADTILVAPEVAFERYRTPRPEPTWDFYRAGADGLGEPTTFGPVAPNLPPTDKPAAAMVDERALALGDVGEDVPALALVPVEDPQPIVRAGGRVVVLSGSGDGLVDAAAAGLIDGTETIRYPAAIPSDDRADAIVGSDLVVVTDTNRVRARQWRGSQDVWGFTEDGVHPGLLVDDPADHRLEAIPDQGDENVTVATSEGPVRATASAYGEPNAYRPEARAALAVDGDPETAWLVADRDEPLGQRLRIDADHAVGAITVLQPHDRRPDRWITEVRLTTSTGEDRIVRLTGASRSADGQRIELGDPAVWWELEITDTNVPPAPIYPGRGPVGFAEVSTALGPSREVVRLPTDTLSQVDADTPVAIVLTRLRTDPLDRWRRDPEAAMVRSFRLTEPEQMALDTSARLDRRASDSVLADLFDADTAVATERLTGDPAAGGWAATDGDPATAWLTPFGSAEGASISVPVTSGARPDGIDLQVAVGPHLGRPTEVEIGRGDAHETVPLEPSDADGRYRIGLGDLASAPGPLTITVTATNAVTTVDRRYGDTTLLPVGIAEVTGPGLASQGLPARLDTGCRRDLLRVDGRAFPVRFTGPTAGALAGDELVVTPCGSGDTLGLGAGRHEVVAAPGSRTGLDIDRLVLTNPTARDELAAPPPERPEVVVRTGHDRRTIRVGPCPDGCWLVQGEGWNPGWSARIGGDSLGRPEFVSGGMNGWFLPPSSEETTVHLRWTPQRWIWGAIAATIGALLVCLALILLDRRRASADGTEPPALAPPWRADARRHHLVWVTATIASAFVVSPSWGLVALAVSLPLVVVRRSALVGLVGLVGLVAITADLVQYQRIEDPAAGFGWVQNVAPDHRAAFAMVILVVAATLPGHARRGPPNTDTPAVGAATAPVEGVGPRADRREA